MGWATKWWSAHFPVSKFNPQLCFPLYWYLNAHPRHHMWFMTYDDQPVSICNMKIQPVLLNGAQNLYYHIFWGYPWPAIFFSNKAIIPRGSNIAMDNGWCIVGLPNWWWCSSSRTVKVYQRVNDIVRRGFPSRDPKLDAGTWDTNRWIRGTPMTSKKHP